MAINWWAVAETLFKKIPLDKILVPPRDNTKALREFADTFTAPEGQTGMVSEQKAAPATQAPEKVSPVAAPARVLPTSEETRLELKRRLAKELYKAELDLSNKLRIAGKPCDCLDSKHTLLLEAVAEELIAQEPDNPIYFEIMDWLKRNQPKVTIEAIGSGQYDDAYPRMAAEFKGFRKTIMGTTVLTAMVEPKEQISLEAAKQLIQEPPAADLPGDTPMRQRAQELAKRVRAGELSRSEATAMLADDLAKEDK